MTLKVRLTQQLYAGPHRIGVPELTVRLRRADNIGLKHRALVDTGAAFTLATMDVARSIGLDADAVRRSTDRTVLAGASGGASEAWGWNVDLILGGGSPAERLTLDGAWVYFTGWPLAGYDLLLGHHDVFERLTFSVLNHAPTPAFVLRAPTAR